MKLPFLYHIYGLHLCANLPIPGQVALPFTLKADVQVWLNVPPPRLNETWQQIEYISSYHDAHGEPALTVWKLDGGYFRLRYSDGTECVLEREGTQLWVTWPETLTLEDIGTYLLGPALGFVLRLRGITCLHASAIAVDDCAIVLLGGAGAGKSTTAATFTRLGYAVLSDDLVPLQDEGDCFLAQPGYPRLRLWPKSVDALYGSPDALPRLTPSWDKRYLDLTANPEQFHGQPLSLAAIYILGERSADSVAPFVEAVPPHTGLIHLVAHTYANRLLDKEMRAKEFEVLNRVIARVPVRRVIPHADFVHLSKLCHTLLDDFREEVVRRGKSVY